MFLLLILLSIFCIYSQSIFNVTVTPNLSNIISNNVISSYFILQTPLNKGILYSNNLQASTSVEIYYSKNLTYLAFNPYDISVTSVTNTCVSVYYDSTILIVNIVYSNGTISTLNLNLNICAHDQQSLPTSTNSIVFVGSALYTPFQFNITDKNDRFGLSDGLLSTYAYLNPNTNIPLTNAGIQFISNPNTSIGNIIECGNPTFTYIFPVNTILQPINWCFYSNKIDGNVIINYYVFDNAGGRSVSSYSIEFTTRELQLCNQLNCHYSTISGIELTLDLSKNLTQSSLHPITISSNITFVITSLPNNGNLFYYQNSSQLVTVGSLISYPFFVVYQGNLGYFNRYRYPDGVVSFNYTNGNPLCTSDSCLESFQAYAITNYNGFTTSSNSAIMNIYVDEIINDVMTTCLYSYLLLSWEFSACLSLGLNDNSGTPIPIFVVGDDGRAVPEYHIKVTSLPTYGTLYLNLGQGDVYIIGPVININFTLSTPLSSTPNFLYVPNQGYFNRLMYDTNPATYISSINQTGLQVGNSPCLNPPECFDFFNFVTVSSYNSSLVSDPPAIYELLVYIENVNNLIVCSVDGYSIWDSSSSCISSGYESNLFYDNSEIPIYLNVGNLPYNEYDSFSYQILTVPDNGALFFNLATDNDTLIPGAQVFPGQTISPILLDETVPRLIYIGNLDYFNVVAQDGDPNEYYNDQKGVPFNNCNSGNGCFDIFTFQAINKDKTIISNLGTYYIKVVSLISNATFESVYSFQYNTLEYFFLNNSFNYSDPDGDVYKVQLEFTFYYGFLGSFYTNNIVFSGGSTTQNCFQTSGCPNYVAMYGLPSDIKLMFANMFFFNNVELNSSGYFQIYTSLIKKETYGVTTSNAFIEDSTIDLVLAQDPIYYSYFDGFDYSIQDILFQPPSNCTTFDNCGCNIESGDCSQFYSDANNNDKCNQTNIILSVCLPLIFVVGLIIIFLQMKLLGYLDCCKKNNKTRKVTPTQEEEKQPLITKPNKIE